MSGEYSLPAISLSGVIQRGIWVFQEIPPYPFYVSPEIEEPVHRRHAKREQLSVCHVHSQPHVHRVLVRKFPTSYAEVGKDVGELVNFFVQLKHPKKQIFFFEIKNANFWFYCYRTVFSSACTEGRHTCILCKAVYVTGPRIDGVVNSRKTFFKVSLSFRDSYSKY